MPAACCPQRHLPRRALNTQPHPWETRVCLCHPQNLRDQVAVRRAEADKELKRRERLEKEMKEMVRREAHACVCVFEGEAHVCA